MVAFIDNPEPQEFNMEVAEFLCVLRIDESRGRQLVLRQNAVQIGAVKDRELPLGHHEIGFNRSAM